MVTVALEPLQDALERWYRTNDRPLRVGAFNSGGTAMSVPKLAEVNGIRQLLLSPLETEDEVKKLFFSELGYDRFVNQGLLEVIFKHIMAKDSSQIIDDDRAPMSDAISESANNLDGILLFHGTDTGAATAKYITFTFPYFNPQVIALSGSRLENWTKPIVIVSSQEGAMTALYDESENAPTLFRLSGSDADRNIRLGLLSIADGNIGESGLLTNDNQLLRGSASMKVSEINIPPYSTDILVGPVGLYSAVGLLYSGQVLRPSLRTRGYEAPPFILDNIGNFEKEVLIAHDHQHLQLASLYLQHREDDLGTLVGKSLPQAVVYVTVGAGNVPARDYDILKGLVEEDIPVIRVPIVGGRIPNTQLYDVPGHDLPAVNMLPDTARYKLQASLALADKIGINSDKRQFVEKMVAESWGLEILPQR